tara:strand:- start:1433 stop:1828 length:396 start_codon:yes stop_codon:yes gene_type:complete
MRIPKTSNRWQIKITQDGWLTTKGGFPLSVDDMRERMDALYGMADNLGVWVVLNMMRQGLPYCETRIGCALQEPRLSLAVKFMENYQALLHEYHNDYSMGMNHMENTPEGMRFFKLDSNRDWLWKEVEKNE